MDLSGIIAITGKPGLYKVVANGRSSIIVESLTDGKKMPAYASSRISALEDISIYTYSEDVSLSVVFKNIYDREKGGKAIDHNKSNDELRAYLETVLPEFDKERVYNSDIKKLFQWYNQLHATGNLKLKEVEKPKAKKSDEKAEDSPKKVATKKAAPKVEKDTKVKTAAAPKKSAKPADGGKKVATTRKTSTSRGK
jgi:hypothetical protein